MLSRHPRFSRTIGVTWGFTFAIIALSFCGKFGGCVVASRMIGFSWRESGAIGSFMSCKGYVVDPNAKYVF